MWLHSQPYAESVCMSMLWINEKPDYSIHILWAGPTPTRARQRCAKLSSFSLWPNKNFLFQAEAHIWIWSFAGSMSSSSFVLPLKSGPRSTHHFLFPFFQNTQDIDTGMYTTHKLVNTSEMWVGSRPIPKRPVDAPCLTSHVPWLPVVTAADQYYGHLRESCMAFAPLNITGEEL